MKILRALTFGLSLLFLTCSCGTMATATGQKKEFGVYSGTKRSIANGSHTILDTPLSFVADTLLLPITVPRALLNNPSEPESKTTGLAPGSK